MMTYTLLDALQPPGLTADLITAVSGTTDGINWTIESVFARRPGYRLFIGGSWMATFDSPAAARYYRDRYFDLLAMETATANQAAAVRLEA